MARLKLHSTDGSIAKNREYIWPQPPTPGEDPSDVEEDEEDYRCLERFSLFTRGAAPAAPAAAAAAESIWRELRIFNRGRHLRTGGIGCELSRSLY